jgi:recombination protein RecA
MANKVEEVRLEINKIMKKDVLGYASDEKYRITRISTGCLTLDLLLGGGVARGRFTELFGNYSTLKTYTSLRTIASAQKRDLGCMFVDAEHSFDPEWAEKLGVNLKRLLVITPEYGEQTIDAVEAAIRSNEFGVIVIDSVAALIPKPELEQSAEKEQMGVMGKMMSKMMRRLNAANQQTAVIMINQIREKIGIVWGKPETTTGGRALPFYAGQRVEFRRAEKIKEKDKIVGYKVTIRIEKDKTGPNVERVGQITYLTGTGIDVAEELLTLGEIGGFVTKRGASYSLGAKSFHGRETAKRYLSGSKVARKKLRRKIRAI